MSLGVPIFQGPTTVEEISDFAWYIEVPGGTSGHCNNVSIWSSYPSNNVSLWNV